MSQPPHFFIGSAVPGGGIFIYKSFRELGVETLTTRTNERA